MTGSKERHFATLILKVQCTPGTSGRYISLNAEKYFERVRSYQSIQAYQKALRQRSVWVDPYSQRAKSDMAYTETLFCAGHGGMAGRRCCEKSPE